MFNSLNNIFDCTSHNVDKVKIETKKSYIDFQPNDEAVTYYTTYVEFVMDNKTSIRFALYRDHAPVAIVWDEKKPIKIEGETDES